LIWGVFQQPVKAQEYNDVGMLKHVVGAMLQLSASGIYSASAPEILTWAKLNIDAMKQRSQLESGNAVNEMLSKTAWSGRTFHGTEIREFSDLTKYLADSTKAAREESYPAAAHEVIKLMDSDLQLFARCLVLSNHAENRYYKTPVLAYADPASFVAAVAELQGIHLRTLVLTIQERYEHFQTELAPEGPWLESIANLLQAEISKRPHTMSCFWLKLLREKATAAATALSAFPPASPPVAEEASSTPAA
jgi:hypothetical protein